MDKVIIIGGGESVGKFCLADICKSGYSIGVNDACVFAPVNIGLSMDRRWAEYRYPKLSEQEGLHLVLRRSAAQNLDNLDIKNSHYQKHYTTFECSHESDILSETPGILNGRNSGYCALNYAYQLKPKQIFLFGMDMEGGYWYPAYPWSKDAKGQKSQAWIDGFSVAKKQCDEKGIEVFIVGKSRINDFPIITYEEFLKC